MNIDDGDAYESFGAHYLHHLVELMDEALKEVVPEAVRRQQVCEQFLFSLGTLHDDGEVETEQGTARPVLAFEDGETLRVPNEEFAMHEYVHGVSAEFYEDEIPSDDDLEDDDEED